MSIVNDLRRRLGMTQEAFAEFCDVSRVSIARYDAGAPLSRQNAEKIARACDVSIDYLLAFDTPEEGSVRLSEPAAPLLSEEEQQVLKDFRALSSKGRKRAIETLHELNVVYAKK